IPDKYMGANLAKRFARINKRLILWDGRCEVHEQFAENISLLVTSYPNADVLLHWEVPESTVTSSLKEDKGVLGSTSDIISYVGASPRDQFILGSECDLGATLKGLYPQKQFITPCISCAYMKKINLFNTLAALRAIGSREQAS